jgi:hypothetical protein
MDKHIELVKKWQDDPDSVTTEELKANTNAAYDAASAAVTALTDAAYYASYGNDEVAEYYVKKYEKLTGQKGNE